MRNYQINKRLSRQFPYCLKIPYGPVKLFCSNRPRGSHGVRGKMCVIKKGGALENEVKKGGALENEGIKMIN